MINDWLLSLLYAAWLAASTMPMGFMLGSSCSPCCGGCGVADGKPRTDPKDEGTWVPSGTWRGVGGVTWTFNANPGNDSGETWFFFGSSSTSKEGGFASLAERRDWRNICNWYSNKTTSPSIVPGVPISLNQRATRLPPNDAVVHIYSFVDTTNGGPVTVKNAYFWAGGLVGSSEITTTTAAHDSPGGCVFNYSSRNTVGSVVNGGATLNLVARNESTINDGATFNEFSINDDATVNGGATFNDSSVNFGFLAIVNDGATFNDSSKNDIGATVNDGATFNGSSRNNSLKVNGGATFNDSSINDFGIVNGGATFNDAACSTRQTGIAFPPCTRKFIAHPTDLPTCNGTAPDGCANFGDTCGCG